MSGIVGGKIEKKLVTQKSIKNRPLIGKIRSILLTLSFDFVILIVQRGDHMSITATELKMNLAKYLLLAATQDIYVTKNGKVVAKLTSPYQDKLSTAESLIGILSDDISLEEAKEERLSKV